MNILVACEESQAVATELHKLGHEAFSCDVLPCSGGHPEYHIQGDVLPLVNGNCEFKTMTGGGVPDQRSMGYADRFPSLYLSIQCRCLPVVPEKRSA